MDQPPEPLPPFPRRRRRKSPQSWPSSNEIHIRRCIALAMAQARLKWSQTNGYEGIKAQRDIADAEADLALNPLTADEKGITALLKPHLDNLKRRVAFRTSQGDDADLAQETLRILHERFPFMARGLPPIIDRPLVMDAEVELVARGGVPADYPEIHAHVQAALQRPIPEPMAGEWVIRLPVRDAITARRAGFPAREAIPVVNRLELSETKVQDGLVISQVVQIADILKSHDLGYLGNETFRVVGFQNEDDLEDFITDQPKTVNLDPVTATITVLRNLSVHTGEKNEGGVARLERLQRYLETQRKIREKFPHAVRRPQGEFDSFLARATPKGYHVGPHVIRFAQQADAVQFALKFGA